MIKSLLGHGKNNPDNENDKKSDLKGGNILNEEQLTCMNLELMFEEDEIKENSAYKEYIEIQDSIDKKNRKSNVLKIN